MAYKNIVTIKDENGYREETWLFNDYEEMQETLDEQLANGIILDWWIKN